MGNSFGLVEALFSKLGSLVKGLNCEDLVLPFSEKYRAVEHFTWFEQEVVSTRNVEIDPNIHPKNI